MKYFEILTSNPLYLCGTILLFMSYFAFFNVKSEFVNNEKDEKNQQRPISKLGLLTISIIVIFGISLIFVGNYFEKQNIDNATKVSLIKFVEESENLHAKNYLQNHIENNITFAEYRDLKKTLHSIILNDKNKIYKELIDRKVMEEPIDATN